MVFLLRMTCQKMSNGLFTLFLPLSMTWVILFHFVWQLQCPITGDEKKDIWMALRPTLPYFGTILWFGGRGQDAHNKRGMFGRMGNGLGIKRLRGEAILRHASSRHKAFVLSVQWKRRCILLFVPAGIDKNL